MKHISFYLKIATTFMLLFCILSSRHISRAANDFTNSLQNNVPAIDDKADLFTDYEEVSILDKAKQQRDQTGFQYIIVTTDKPERGSLTNELEYIYNNCRDSISSNGTVLLLIYNNKGSFECEIQGYTKARDYLPPEMCDNIESRLINLNASDIIEHFFTYLSEVTDGTYIYAETVENDTSLNVAFIILIWLSCIIVISFAVFYVTPKKTPSSELVLPKPTLHIITKKDTYLRTHKSIYKL